MVKAHELVSMSKITYNFESGYTSTAVSNETFWKGVSAYFSHLVRINDAKGIGWNNISPRAPNPAFNRTDRTYVFTGQVIIPAMSATDFDAFVAPITRDLDALGILTNSTSGWWASYPAYSFRPNGPGEGVGNNRFVSRLFPRALFVDPHSAAFATAMAAIRTWVVDGGYRFHSVDYHPSTTIAGYPGTSSAVNPHLRRALVHATGFDSMSYGPERSAEEMRASHARLDEYAQAWREASPGSGAYMNEADVEEPGFQESFYGENYERLGEIKRGRDPWGVFYAVTGVGSEGWRVEGTEGLPTQEGRLCRV